MEVTKEQKEEIKYILDSTKQDIQRVMSLHMHCDDYKLYKLYGRLNGAETILKILNINTEKF
jgi:hypothetical protein